MPLTPQSPFYQPVLEALITPTIASLAHGAYLAQTGWPPTSSTSLNPGWPGIFVGLVIATISFFVIRPFAGRPFARRVAFVSCIVGFSTAMICLVPRLAT
jgi:hypothetical protein